MKVEVETEDVAGWGDEDELIIDEGPSVGVVSM